MSKIEQKESTQLGNCRNVLHQTNNKGQGYQQPKLVEYYVENFSNYRPQF